MSTELQAWVDHLVRAQPRWVAGGRDPYRGLDCLGLLLHLQRMLGHRVPPEADMDLRVESADRATVARYLAGGAWVSVQGPGREGDGLYCLDRWGGPHVIGDIGDGWGVSTSAEHGVHRVRLGSLGGTTSRYRLRTVACPTT